jgi:Flp pilus assembly protein TadG
VLLLKREMGGGVVTRTRTTAVRREAGSTTLETVIVFPAIVLLTIGVLQAGFWMLGRSVALGAAQEAARAGAAIDGSNTAAQAEGRDFASQTAHGLLRDVTVAVNRGPYQVTVAVTGTILDITPLLPFPDTVTQSASLPVERRT